MINGEGAVMGDGWYEARTCRRVDDVQTNSVSFDLPDWPPSANPSQRTADKLTTDVQTNNSVSVRGQVSRIFFPTIHRSVHSFRIIFKI